jgi:mannose-1-phosphate guanylyltransferase
VSIERETFPALIVAGGLFARDDGGAYWLDTGTPEAYLRAQLDIIDGRYQGEGTADANPIDPCAVIADGATVIRSAIGPKAVVDAGAEVSASVVMAGAHIGPGARVCDSIIGPDADVGRGASVEDLSILGENVSIAAGEAVRAARLPEEAP